MSNTAEDREYQEHMKRIEKAVSRFPQVHKLLNKIGDNTFYSQMDVTEQALLMCPDVERYQAHINHELSHEIMNVAQAKAAVSVKTETRPHSAYGKVHVTTASAVIYTPKQIQELMLEFLEELTGYKLRELTPYARTEYSTPPKGDL